MFWLVPIEWVTSQRLCTVYTIHCLYIACTYSMYYNVCIQCLCRCRGRQGRAFFLTVAKVLEIGHFYSESSKSANPGSAGAVKDVKSCPWHTHNLFFSRSSCVFCWACVRFRILFEDLALNPGDQIRMLQTLGYTLIHPLLAHYCSEKR